MPDEKPRTIYADLIHEHCSACNEFDNLLKFKFDNGAYAVVHPGCQSMTIYEIPEGAQNPQGCQYGFEHNKPCNRTPATVYTTQSKEGEATTIPLCSFHVLFLRDHFPQITNLIPHAAGKGAKD